MLQHSNPLINCPLDEFDSNYPSGRSIKILNVVDCLTVKRSIRSRLVEFSVLTYPYNAFLILYVPHKRK